METNKMTARNFEYLRRMLRKYAHCWCEYPSDRLAGWVHDYDTGRIESPEAWDEYCEFNGLDRTHNAGDILA